MGLSKVHLLSVFTWFCSLGFSRMHSATQGFYHIKFPFGLPSSSLLSRLWWGEGGGQLLSSPFGYLPVAASKGPLVLLSFTFRTSTSPLRWGYCSIRKLIPPLVPPPLEEVLLPSICGLILPGLFQVFGFLPYFGLLGSFKECWPPGSSLAVSPPICR